MNGTVRYAYTLHSQAVAAMPHGVSERTQVRCTQRRKHYQFIVGHYILQVTFHATLQQGRNARQLQRSQKMQPSCPFYRTD